MNGSKNRVEQRRFGRRETAYAGLMKFKHRPSLLCIVRDLSEGGARIEIAIPFLLPSRLTLQIGSEGFEAECAVRHQTPTALGLEFTKVNDRRLLDNLLARAPLSVVDAVPPAPIAPRPRAEPLPVADRAWRRSLITGGGQVDV